ncbi:CDK5 regulatory subunit-associated protein 2 isoform X2 [Oxyura jamaicensis]|uniref:CDK5 regulatory subunit-associated protein 2 isoform X2 n=1 Tax=Oxyura jamaicensis TaxID=8884 RepID=UPI0015A6841F|nr:CDK5 regulatory subunit-associated protein 2 isoform X2 [Oxyura jamaicensis]
MALGLCRPAGSLHSPLPALPSPNMAPTGPPLAGALTKHGGSPLVSTVPSLGSPPRRLQRLHPGRRKDGGSDCGRLNSSEAAKAAHKGAAAAAGGAMDSLPGADPTLPVAFEDSASQLPDVSRGDPQLGPAGSRGLPDVAEDTISPTRARTMKDYENQITDLKKENFNLKLRIYFLEMRMQQKFDGPTEEIYKINIELKVEIESLKRDLQEREKLLIKASKAVESLAQGGDVEIQRVKEEAQKKLQEMEEILTGRINLLEEDLKAAQEEAEKAIVMTEKEKALRMAAEQKLSSIPNAPAKDLHMIAGADKDRLIEQLNLSLKSKEAIIQHLEEEKSQSGSCDGNLSAEKIRELTIALRHEKDSEIEAVRMELKNERNSFEKKIQSLQEELQERENELAVEKKNGLKRDKTIQGLTVALKAKEKENEELGSEIEDLNASLTKAREATHKAHMQKFKGAEDYQALLIEKETLLAELRSENLTKDAENRKLQRRIKRTDQELNDLNLEREKMEKELDEAQLQKSRSDKTINDLRNQLEKLHGEMTEKEKAAEHYNILLSESNQKLQSQELVIKQLTDSVNQKDLLLQNFDETIKEKNGELQELLLKNKSLLRANEELELKNEGLVKEKCAVQSQSIIRIVRELEEKKESEYEKLILALKKEQNIYSTLVKTFKESDSLNTLQTELNNIFMLRKQLEEDILANRNLQKILEDQIKDIRNRQDETLSFCGDQTSYMSICLGEQDHLNLQIDQLSLEELKKKVTDLLLMVKDLQSINQELKKKQLGLSTTDSQGKEALKILNQIKFLETTEEPVMQTEDGDNDRRMQNSSFYERVSQVYLQRSMDCPSEVDKQSDSAFLPKKSRLPVLLRSSRPLGNVPLKLRERKSDSQLQHHTRLPYEDLKASEVQNKQFQAQTNGELLLSESVTENLEEEPAEESTLVRVTSLIKLDDSGAQVDLQDGELDTGVNSEYLLYKNQQNCQEMENHHNISNVNIQPSLKEINEEFYSMEHEDIDSATANSGSKCLRSLKLSVTSTDALDDCEVLDDKEELKQRIKNMKSELEKYKMFVFHLQTSDQLVLSGISNIFLSDTALPVEGHVMQGQDTAMQEIKPFSSLHQPMGYEIHAENRNSQSSKVPDAWTAQNLRELLSANEEGLEKEQVADIHLDEVYCLQNKLREALPSKYDSLVHSQAQELSFQHQQIKEIRGGCVTYHQHLTSLIKAFEELLQASDVDYYVAEGFREQLNQSVLLFEKLERKFLYEESVGAEVTILYELAQRENEKNTTMYQQLKDESPVPSALHSLSDFDLSEKSSLGSPEHRHDLGEGQCGTLALLPNKFPPELLIEHLQEIRILRQRLEYSIKNNERLRKQLERQVTDKELDQGSANIFSRGSEQDNSLTSEVHFLRKQNQVLNAMLAKGSRDKQKENEKLRESLSKKNAIIEHLHEDYECIKKENERLKKQIGKKEDETKYLTCEIYSSRNELNRLQTEMNVKQRQLSENEKLLQSLRTEIKVYEKLEEAKMKRTDPKCDASEEFRKDQNNPVDLRELLTEIQSLRVQLERSIETNKTLHEKLEEQLSKEKKEEVGSVSAVNINYLFKQESQHYAGMNENLCKCPAASRNICELQKHGHCISLAKAGTQSASKDDLDSTSSSSTACTPRLVPGHRMWADKNGRHVLGLIEDYNALRKQISEGQQVLEEMEISLREVTGTKVQEPGIKVPDQASLHSFSANTNTVQQILEEAARLLKLLWRVSLPMKAVHSTTHGTQDEGMKAEILRLRKKLSEQEKKLHSTVKRLHSTNQLKENMEKVIIDQLVLTHDVLKKARGNLEVPPPDNQKSASYTSKKRIL